MSRWMDAEPLLKLIDQREHKKDAGEPIRDYFDAVTRLAEGLVELNERITR